MQGAGRRRGKGGNSSGAVGVATSSAGEDNQGGAELSKALKEVTRGMNLTLQFRHTQHCFAIVFIKQLQLSDFSF